MNYRAEIAAMLRTMPTDWRRQYRSGREKLGYGLPDAPSPEQAMMLIGITAGGHESGDVAVGPNRVPQAVKEAAMKGLRLSHRHNYGAWDFIGIARAIELVLSPGVSNRTVERMRNYFVRHQKDKAGKNFGNDASPSRGYMAWLNWGGDPGQEWTMKKRNPRYSVVAVTPGYAVLDVVKATYPTREEALEAVTLGPAHERKPWRQHGDEYEWTGGHNIWAKPARQNPAGGTKGTMRRNPMNIVEDGRTFRIFLDGVDTGRYATSRAKAEEILARLQASEGSPKREKKQRPVDPFALRPFAKPVRPPEPWRAAPPAPMPAVAPPVAASGPAPFAKDAKTKWKFSNETASPVASWQARSVLRHGRVRIQNEPLEPRAKGYSVVYVQHPVETAVAYLVKHPARGGLIDLYDVTAAWFLTELDESPPRGVTEKVLNDAIKAALKTHPLPSPASYMLGRS